MDRILHDANNAQRILKLTADTMLLVDRHGVCVDIEPHVICGSCKKTFF